jgi:beta-1,4-mannooligosaccharide/beta-1,4-mannosyl-N-acetylglucosamine phosphorylase
MPGPLVTRHARNPVLTADDLPYPATLVYNPGVVRTDDRYVMAFRVDHGYATDRVGYGFGSIDIGIAFSEDGVLWQVQDRTILGELKDDEHLWAYDPRLVAIDGEWFITFCVDTRHGMRAGIARTTDFESFEVVSLSLPDLRNVVLFPEKIGGDYVRLERPFPIYLRRTWGQVDRFDIWVSRSPDLVHWGETELLLAVEQVPFANEKIGPGPPPIRTADGWLTLFHAVDTEPTRAPGGWEGTWIKRYTAGAMLLDLNDPAKVAGMCPHPILVPEAPYELTEGFRTNVVFPTGLVADGDTAMIYYGAADSVICLATASISELVDSTRVAPQPAQDELEQRGAAVPVPQPATE